MINWNKKSTMKPMTEIHLNWEFFPPFNWSVSSRTWTRNYPHIFANPLLKFFACEQAQTLIPNIKALLTLIKSVHKQHVFFRFNNLPNSVNKGKKSKKRQEKGTRRTLVRLLKISRKKKVVACSGFCSDYLLITE